jgi:hypothetical protein
MKRDLYILGLDILGADPKRAYVIRHNAEAYAVNVMAGDDAIKHIGEDTPAFLLQIGTAVDVVDSSVANSHNVLYTPVTVPGRDGVYYVQERSIGYEKAKPPFVTALRAQPRDLEAEENDRLRTVMWWILGIVGAGAVAIGGYHLATSKPRRGVHA